MGGCASVPAELKKGDSSLPPELAKEEAVLTAEEVKTEQAEKKVEGGEEETGKEEKEVVERSKGPSLGNLLDQVIFRLDISKSYATTLHQSIHISATGSRCHMNNEESVPVRNLAIL